MSVLPGELDIEIYRGDNFKQGFTFTNPAANAWTTGSPLNLIGWTWLAQWRSAPDSTDVVNFGVDSSRANIGEISITMSAIDTAVLPGDGCYDLQGRRTSTGEIVTYVFGKARFRKDVTR